MIKYTFSEKEIRCGNKREELNDSNGGLDGPRGSGTRRVLAWLESSGRRDSGFNFSHLADRANRRQRHDSAAGQDFHLTPWPVPFLGHARRGFVRLAGLPVLAPH